MWHWGTWFSSPCGTEGHGLAVELVLSGHWLDSILKVFSNHGSQWAGHSELVMYLLRLLSSFWVPTHGALNTDILLRFLMLYYTVCAISDMVVKICHKLTGSPATLLPALLPVLPQHTYIHSDTGSESSSFPCGTSPVSKQRCSISPWCQSGTCHVGPRLMQYLIILIHYFFGKHTEWLCLDQNLSVVVRSEKGILI